MNEPYQNWDKTVFLGTIYHLSIRVLSSTLRYCFTEFLTFKVNAILYSSYRCRYFFVFSTKGALVWLLLYTFYFCEDLHIF